MWAVLVLESLIFDDRSDFTAAFGLAECESHLVALCHVLSGRLVGLEGHRHGWPADCGDRPMIDGDRARCSIHGRDRTFAVRDRNSVAYGKSVSVRVDLGGRPFLKKN